MILCPLDNSEYGKVCPYRYYPIVPEDTPQHMRKFMHRSVCGRGTMLCLGEQQDDEDADNH